MLPLLPLVTTLSMAAMVVDPLPTRPVQFALRGATLFLGGSIHNLAQVVGAGDLFRPAAVAARGIGTRFARLARARRRPWR